jgi:hypothetical protein
MTISQKQSVNIEGLDRARQLLRGTPKRLYFVVPDDLFDSFKLVESGGRALAGVDQFALRIKMHI